MYFKQCFYETWIQFEQILGQSPILHKQVWVKLRQYSINVNHLLPSNQTLIMLQFNLWLVLPLIQKDAQLTLVTNPAMGASPPLRIHFHLSCLAANRRDEHDTCILEFRFFCFFLIKFEAKKRSQKLP